MQEEREGGGSKGRAQTLTPPPAGLQETLERRQRQRIVFGAGSKSTLFPFPFFFVHQEVKTATFTTSSGSPAPLDLFHQQLISPSRRFSVFTMVTVAPNKCCTSAPLPLPCPFSPPSPGNVERQVKMRPSPTTSNCCVN